MNPPSPSRLVFLMHRGTSGIKSLLDQVGPRDQDCRREAVDDPRPRAPAGSFDGVLVDSGRGRRRHGADVVEVARRPWSWRQRLRLGRAPAELHTGSGSQAASRRG